MKPRAIGLSAATFLSLAIAAEAHATEQTTVSGYAHVDWTVFRQSSQDEISEAGEPLNENRFLLRRGRLKIEREQGPIYGAFELDANTLNSLQVRPINAEATFKWPADRPYARTPWSTDPTGLSLHPHVNWEADATRLEQTSKAEPWFMVTAGLFRTPFGFEVPEPELGRPFLDRSAMSSAMFPQSFDLGLRIVGGFRFVRYAFAIMNGDPIGERTFPGRDPNESKDLVFRVGGAGSLFDGLELEAGVSGVSGRGFHKGVPTTKDSIQWQDADDDGTVDSLNEIKVVPGSAARPSSSFKRFAMGADLRATVTIPVLGAFQLRGEIVRGKNIDRGLQVSDPVTQGRDLRQLGYYVGGSQEITRWALVGVRYDRYDPDSDASEQEPFASVPRDLSYSTWSFMAMARMRPARLVAQYDHRGNALGRDASGRPTTLADDSFTLRAEVQF